MMRLAGWAACLKRPSGLLTKVFLIHASVLALAAVAVPAGIDMLLESRAAFYAQRVLTDRARLVATALSVAADGSLRLADGRYSREGENGEFGFAVVDDAMAVLFASSPVAVRLLAPLPRGPAALFAEVAADGNRYATVSFPVSVEARTVWVQLGWNTSQEEVIFDDVVRDFLGSAVALTVPLLALLLLFDMMLVRRFFRPVLTLSRHVRDLDPARMEARLPVDALPAEILPLADAFNLALAKLERASQLQREFTADAAHELRTPLAVLNARLESLPAGEQREGLLADAARMARIVAQLLEIARLEQPDATPAEVDLLAVCRDVVGSLAPEAIARGQSLGLTEPQRLAAWPVGAREQDVWHMLRNLVENAIRHTQPGSTIDVCLDADGTLTVRDDGPGIPEELQPYIFRRFWRHRRSGGAGAGLGLAIVQRVAQANGGSVAVQSEPGRGTTFVVRLPRSGQPLPQRTVFNVSLVPSKL